jgi:hypothetical protein
MNNEEGSFVTGLYWGILLSVPLWISLVGWVKLILRILI